MVVTELSVSQDVIKHVNMLGAWKIQPAIHVELLLLKWYIGQIMEMKFELLAFTVTWIL